MLREALTNPDVEYDIKATVTQIGQTQFTQKNGKPFQTVNLNDGVTASKAKIFQGTGVPIPVSFEGQSLFFKVRGWKNPQSGLVSISGFWVNNPPQQKASPAPQQQANPVPQQQQHKDPQQEMMDRVYAINTASIALQNTFGRDDNLYNIAEQTTELAEIHLRYIQAGIAYKVEQAEPEPDGMPN